MTHTPRGPRATDLVQALCEQIERTWNQHRDATIVDRLAAEHPTLAEALYEHFALIVRTELDAGGPDPAFATLDARARRWLEGGGYARVAEVARAHAAGTFAAGEHPPEPTPVPGDFEHSAPTALPRRAAPSRHAASPGIGGADAPAATESTAAVVPSPLTPHAPSPAAGTPAAGVVPRSGGGQPPRRATTPGTSAGASRRPHSRRTAAPTTFLGLLTERTGATPADLAATLGLTANFLVGADTLGASLPARARDELARRAESRYGVARPTSVALLEAGAALPMAASRRTGYGARLTYADLVRHSGLAPAEEAFWFALASPDTPPST